MHVLVEIGVDQDAALGEEFVQVSDSHSVCVNVADLELALRKGTLGRLLHLLRLWLRSE